MIPTKEPAPQIVDTQGRRVHSMPPTRGLVVLAGSSAGRVGVIEKASRDNISGASLITKTGRWRLQSAVSRAGYRPSRG